MRLPSPPQSTAHNWTCPPVLAWLPLKFPVAKYHAGNTWESVDIGFGERTCSTHSQKMLHFAQTAGMQEGVTRRSNAHFHTHTHMHTLRLKRKKGKKKGGSSLQHLSKTFKKATALFCLQRCPRDLTVTMRTPVSLQLTDCTKWVWCHNPHRGRSPSLRIPSEAGAIVGGPGWEACSTGPMPAVGFGVKVPLLIYPRISCGPFWEAPLSSVTACVPSH